MRLNGSMGCQIVWSLFLRWYPSFLPSDLTMTDCVQLWYRRFLSAIENGDEMWMVGRVVVFVGEVKLLECVINKLEGVVKGGKG